MNDARVPRALRPGAAQDSRDNPGPAPSSASSLLPRLEPRNERLRSGFLIRFLGRGIGMRAASLILQGGYFAACLLAASHAWAQSCAALPATAGQLPVAVTPVTLRILQTEIVPVPGTDG